EEEALAGEGLERGAVEEEELVGRHLDVHEVEGAAGLTSGERVLLAVADAVAEVVPRVPELARGAAALVPAAVAAQDAAGEAGGGAHHGAGALEADERRRRLVLPEVDVGRGEVLAHLEDRGLEVGVED